MAAKIGIGGGVPSPPQPRAAACVPARQKQLRGGNGKICVIARLRSKRDTVVVVVVVVVVVWWWWW